MQALRPSIYGDILGKYLMHSGWIVTFRSSVGHYILDIFREVAENMIENIQYIVTDR